MKADLRAELDLLNTNVDEMIRLCQCAADGGLWTRQEAQRRTARLEFLRAKLNADFAELVVRNARIDQRDFEGQRFAEEPNHPFTDHQAKQTKQRNQTKH